MSTTHPSFGATTTATEVAMAFAGGIKGRTFVITGVSPGSLGEALALSLASQQPSHLILASRTQGRLDEVVRLVYSTYPTLAKGVVKTVLVDLSDWESVRGAAGRIGGLLGDGRGEGGIDGLFNNAGVNVGGRTLNGAGVEMQFATNHVGPFLLTGLLTSLLGGEGRVVLTSSEAHRLSPVRFSDYNQTPGATVAEEDRPRRGLPRGILKDDGGYEPSLAYGQSKTANILMAMGLNVRGFTAFAVMPGTIMTNLPRDMDKQALEALTAGTDAWKDTNQGAATMMVAALDPLLKPEKGVYLDNCQVRRPSKWAADPENVERLWRLSEELVGEKFGRAKASRL